VQTGPAAWGRELYERVLDALGTVAGGSLLDVGCGAGQLCRLAADRFIPVTGVDADPAALARAAQLVPEASFSLASLPDLPQPDGAMAAVTCVQVLMQLANPLAALRELARVTAPGAPVAVTVWGPPELCAVGAFGRALEPLLGGPPPGARSAGPRPPGSPGSPGSSGRAGPPALSAEGRLARLVALAGLEVDVVEDVRCAFDLVDERALLAALYGAELGRRAVEVAGRAPVRKAVLAGLAPYRTADGGYRLENTFRLVVGVA
jgi:SAM-dependent methyltransferase